MSSIRPVKDMNKYSIRLKYKNSRINSSTSSKTSKKTDNSTIEGNHEIPLPFPTFLLSLSTIINTLARPTLPCPRSRNPYRAPISKNPSLSCPRKTTFKSLSRVQILINTAAAAGPLIAHFGPNYAFEISPSRGEGKERRKSGRDNCSRKSSLIYVLSRRIRSNNLSCYSTRG